MKRLRRRDERRQPGTEPFPLERVQAAVTEAEEAARRAVTAREETVESLAEAADEAVVSDAPTVAGETAAVSAAVAVGPRAEVPLWREGAKPRS